MAKTYEELQKEIDEKFELENEEKYLAILAKPTPTIDELWLLPEERFQEWRGKNDYPKLIQSFNENKPNFVRWKNEFGLTDEELASCRFSEFLRQADFKPTETWLYYMEQTFDGKKRKIVAHADLSKKPAMFPKHGEAYRPIRTFLSYEDWCHKHKLKFDLFNVTQRQAPEHQMERVWLDTGFELLKMGGGKPPINGFGILLRGKHLDFVNACGLELTGTIYSGQEGNLNFSYCAVDNLKCTNLKESPSPFFFNCTLENINIENSTINSWKFWQCDLQGDIKDSKLQNVRIYGGTFNPYIKETKFTNVKATHQGTRHEYFGQAYILLKKAYYDQGDDDLAGKYYIREKEYEREKSKGWSYITKSLSYYYWGYGKKPQYVIYFAIATIIVCAGLYLTNPSNIHPVKQEKSILDMLYFSTVTFTTLGYGDMSPMGWLRVVALIEAFFGALTIGFLVAGFSRSKY